MVCEDRVEAEEDGAALAARLAPLLAGVSLGLVGPGQFYGNLALRRVTLLRVEPGPPEALWDGPVAEAQVRILQRALAAAGPVLPGALDTMHATPWAQAWSVPPAPPLVVSRRDGVVLRAAEDGALLVAGRRVERASVVRAEATLSRDWVERQVALVLAGGERLVLAEHLEHFVHLDPTYDAFNLLFDGSWAPELAHALGAALGVPVVVDPAYE